MSTTSSLFDSLLKLPPEVLEKMGFQRPSPTISESDGSDTDNGQNNKRDKKSSDEAIAAEMLKPLIFDDDSASADTPPPRPAWNASPSEIFSLCHPAGPQFFVRDNFLGRDSAMRVRKAVQELRAAGALRAAGMGREGSKWSSKVFRGDEIMWLPNGLNMSPPIESDGAARGVAGSGGVNVSVCELNGVDIRPIQTLLEAVKSMAENVRELDSYSQVTFTGQSSVQVACYPGDGTRYARHVDAHIRKDNKPPSKTRDAVGGDVTAAGGVRKGSASLQPHYRLYTFLYYLNDNWKHEDGGCLRVHPITCSEERHPAPPPAPPAQHWDIEPWLDRLLVFRSDTVPHEVLPAFQSRYAITSWVYGVRSDRQHEGHSPAAPNNLSSTRLVPQVSESSLARAANARASAGGAMASPAISKPIGPSAQNHDMDQEEAREVCSQASSSSSDKVALALAHPSIFVSVPSFRDPECQHTITNLFATATYPSRIFVGVCAQYDPVADLDCFEAEIKCPGQVRILHMPHSEARGPSWARYLLHKLYRDEDFVLQVDSHSRFAPGWDVQLVALHQQCLTLSSHGKAVITTYPAGYDRAKASHFSSSDDDAALPTVLRATHFDEDGMLRLQSSVVVPINGHSKPTQPKQAPAPPPIPSLFWAAGFSFTTGAVMTECPYDPHHKSLFFGEEQSMGARLWTHGYDFFAPPTQVVLHHWSRSYRPTFREVYSAPPDSAVLSVTGHTRRYLQLQRMVAQRRVRGLLRQRSGAFDREEVWGDSFLKPNEEKVLKEDLAKLQQRLSEMSTQLCTELSATGDSAAAVRLEEVRINSTSIANVGLHASWKNAKHYFVPPDWLSVHVAPMEGRFRCRIAAPNTSVPSASVAQLHAVASAARTIESILAAAPAKTIEAGNKNAFGLGTVRQLSEYEAHCGVSFSGGGGGGEPIGEARVTSRAINGGLGEPSKPGVVYCLRELLNRSHITSDDSVLNVK